ALGAHALAFSWALTAKPPLPAAPPALEVELLAPEPPPPAPEPLVTPPPVEEPRVAERAPSVKAAAAPPEPARAGALLTAKADPAPSPAAEEPVDFTNDPSVLGFGSGVVAVGGKALVGAAAARSSPAPASTGTNGLAPRQTGEQLTPASDLSRKPGLGESDPCRGYFPSAATDDVATAAVMVTIGKSGAVSSVRLLSESPPQQGFGAAARTCMSSKRFSPGLDQNGNPTATAIRVNIRFTR
ncbi:MAG TPA: TonB family protein, partial [Polyangiaceae bacterium]|nr:TonB family protein [Polyangiaceae bacterium]